MNRMSRIAETRHLVRRMADDVSCPELIPGQRVVAQSREATGKQTTRSAEMIFVSARDQLGPRLNWTDLEFEFLLLDDLISSAHLPSKYAAGGKWPDLSKAAAISLNWSSGTFLPVRLIAFLQSTPAFATNSTDSFGLRPGFFHCPGFLERLAPEGYTFPPVCQLQCVEN